MNAAPWDIVAVALAWICLGIAGAGTLGAVTLFILGGERLQVPDLESWTDGEPAWESTPLLARLRGRKKADAGPPG